MAKRDPRDERKGRDKQRRLVVLAVVLLGVLAGRLFMLQHLRHAEYSQYSQENRLQRERIIAPRGLIRDHNGVVLVDNVPSFDIVIPWRHEDDVRDVVMRLHEYVPLDTTRIYARFEHWRRRNRGVPFPIVPGANKLVISFVKENYDLFPELRVESKGRRRYRNDDFAAHLIGYVGQATERFLDQAPDHGYQIGDVVGRTGIESVCEPDLRGEDGQSVVAVNASGRVLGELKELLKPPVPGKDVYLTIDSRLQGVLEEEFAKYRAGAAVVLDIEDGAMLCAVSMPQFNPNSFARGIPQDEWHQLNTAETKPLFNRFLQATYPPGSTFKIVSMYGILANGLVSPGEAIVYCTGQHRFGNRAFKCWKSWGHGYMNLHGGFVNSCDSYFYKVAESMDVDILAASARLFGIGARTGIDMPNEAQGLVPDRAYYNRRWGMGKWTQGLVLNNIIGQGEFLATVLHMARVSAAIANGGHLVQPHVIASVDEEPVAVHQRKRIRQLTGPILRRIRTAMEGVVHDEDGTGKASRVQGIRSAGKTGTAQNPQGDDHAWFIGYAPADDPKVAIAIVVEHAGHGGAVAAPIARRLYEAYFYPEVAAASAPRVRVPAPPLSSEESAQPVTRQGPVAPLSSEESTQPVTRQGPVVTPPAAADSADDEAGDAADGSDVSAPPAQAREEDGDNSSENGEDE